MADDKGKFPNWAKMIDSNSVDLFAKERFMKEASDQAFEDRFGIKPDEAVSVNFRANPFDRATFDKFVSDARTMQRNLLANLVADYERPLLAAAIKKRLSEGLKEGGFSLGVYKSEDRETFINVVRHRFVLFKDGEEIKLIDFNITTVHDEVMFEHRSHVGELKL